MDDLSKITSVELEEHLKNWYEDVRCTDKNVKEKFKRAREFRDKYGLNDREALALLNRQKTIIEILNKRQGVS